MRWIATLAQAAAGDPDANRQRIGGAQDYPPS
jgi:hypothetical protein